MWLKGGMDFDNESNNLKVYYQRYLKNSTNARTTSFYRKFEKLVKHGFDKHKFNFVTSQLIDDFEELHKNLDFNEIISYEQLWIVIGKLIERKNRKQLLDLS
jgi:hypothetical protein